MTQRTRKWLAQIGSFVLAGVLLYLALRGVDFSAVGEALLAADYRWLLPLAAVLLLSHLLRAWRWQMLLEALPSDEGHAPHRVSLKTAFYSVMIGYMVNYAAPRLGEVVRSANLARRERLPLSGVIGTVVVERILDVIVLALGLGSVAFLLLDRLGALRELFVDPMLEQLGRLPAASLLIGALVIGGLVVVFTWRAMQAESMVRRLWDDHVRPIAVSFRDGLATVLRAPRRLGLVVTTLAIWFAYLLAAHMPFLLFDMAAPFEISLLDSWSIMLLGAIGVAIPSPGGTGSYHFITIQTLVVLFGVTQSAAATYAVFTHGAQLILYVAVGFLCMVLQGADLGTLKETTEAAQQAPDSAPPPPVSHEESTS